MRDTSVKGGGPSVAIFTLPSSITLEGEDLLGLLFIIGVAPACGANLLQLSCLTERGLSVGGSFSGGLCSPPLAGNGPNEPFWLSGPLHGGFCALGLSGLGFTVTGSYSIAIFWVNSNNFLKLAASLFSSAIALPAA